MAVSDRESNHSRIWDLRLFRWLGGQPRSMEEPDLPGRAGQTLTGLTCRTYTALRLDRILRGSLLLRPEIWIILTLTLLPFLPTMAALVLCAVSLGTVLLSRCDARTGTGPLRFREDLYSPGLRLCGLLSLVFRCQGCTFPLRPFLHPFLVIIKARMPSLGSKFLHKNRSVRFFHVADHKLFILIIDHEQTP